MSRRLRSTSGNNLELLLDTMCNAFGGVMFIALLLAVLSEFTEIKSESAPDSTQAKLRELEYEKLQNEVQVLSDELEGQLRVLDLLKGDVPMRDELIKLKRENAVSEEELEQVEEVLRGLRTRLAELTAEKQGSEAEKEGLAGKVGEATGEVQEAGEAETRQIAGGTVTTSDKTTVWFIVKWNRLYFGTLPIREEAVTRGESLVPGKGKVQQFEAKPGLGLSLEEPGWETSPEVKKVLELTSPQKHSLQFAVYPDSYATFLSARRFFREEKNYGYNWYVMPSADEKLNLSAGPGIVQE